MGEWIQTKEVKLKNSKIEALNKHLQVGIERPLIGKIP